MQIAFYGVKSGSGTSFNLAVLAAVYELYKKREDMRQKTPDTPEIRFVDCSRQRGRTLEQTAKESHLVVLNLCAGDTGIFSAYQTVTSVRTDVLFLLGKYHPDSRKQRDRLALMYRCERNEIGVIPYSMRLAHAVECGQTKSFLQRIMESPVSYEETEISKAVRHTAQLLENCLKDQKEEKGEIRYGRNF